MIDTIIIYRFIHQLKQLPFIDEIWLFGSRARKDHGIRSDIDLAIACPLATGKDWVAVIEIIDNADTLLKIDVLRFEKERISQNLYNNIIKEKEVVHVKNREI